MKKTGFSQETIKLIACITMLIDHTAAILLIPTTADMMAGDTSIAWANVIMRCIGRIAFPVFCFLLVEGANHTRNTKKYALRLLIGAILSEIPYDLAFFGKMTWAHQNVMLTLLLGFGMVEAMKSAKGCLKCICIIPFYCAAEWLHTDYTGDGILLIAMFALVKDVRYEKWARFVGMVLLMWDSKASFSWNLGVPIYYNRFRLLSVIPVFCYDGRKLTRRKALQWAFYLFYPAHILILLFIRTMIQ